MKVGRCEQHETLAPQVYRRSASIAARSCPGWNIPFGVCMAPAQAGTEVNILFAIKPEIPGVRIALRVGQGASGHHACGRNWVRVYKYDRRLSPFLILRSIAPGRDGPGGSRESAPRRLFRLGWAAARLGCNGASMECTIR